MPDEQFDLTNRMVIERLEHRAKKWVPVSRENDATTKN
jgi:hypothetical protein